MGDRSAFYAGIQKFWLQAPVFTEIAGSTHAFKKTVTNKRNINVLC